MVIHEAIGMAEPMVALIDLVESGEKVLSIFIIFVNRLLFISPGSYKDFSRLLGMEGFSDTLLKNHFTLYRGASRAKTHGSSTCFEKGGTLRSGTSSIDISTPFSYIRLFLKGILIIQQ